MSAIATASRLRTLRNALLAVGFAVCAAAATAQAQAPSITLTSPASGSVTNQASPLIAGVTELTEEEEEEGVPYFPEEVTFRDVSEPERTIPPVATPIFPGANWFLTPAEPLPEGTYTIQASEQNEGARPPLNSAPVTFRVDLRAPNPAISAPASGASVSAGSVAVGGSAGKSDGDQPAVTVQVLSAAGSLVEAVEAQSHEGAWSTTLPGLEAGSYTLLAEQSDSAGNVGTSAPVAITVLPAPSPAPPVASFTWFPSNPRVGEAVTLVSSSSDPASPLVGFAWALGPQEALRAGGSSLTTTFQTAGPHAVRLQVADAAGRTGLATETIAVSHQPASLMQPFPIVRIAGRETRSGIRLSLLTVVAPVTAKVTVRIRGAGRRATSVSRLASAARGTAASVLLSFPRFARSIPAGSRLEVSVSKAGEIGKLMRLIPHRGKLPTRQDTCLSPGGAPERCPAS